MVTPYLGWLDSSLSSFMTRRSLGKVLDMFLIIVLAAAALITAARVIWEQ
jgi:hypothetical protein